MLPTLFIEIFLDISAVFIIYFIYFITNLKASGWQVILYHNDNVSGLIFFVTFFKTVCQPILLSYNAKESTQS